MASAKSSRAPPAPTSKDPPSYVPELVSSSKLKDLGVDELALLGVQELRELEREQEVQVAQKQVRMALAESRGDRGKRKEQFSTACLLSQSVGRKDSVASEVASVTESSTETMPGEVWKEQEYTSGGIQRVEGAMKRKLMARFSSDEEEEDLDF